MEELFKLEYFYYLKLEEIFHKGIEKSKVIYAIHSDGCTKITLNVHNYRFYGISIIQPSDKYDKENYDFSKFNTYFEK